MRDLECGHQEQNVERFCRHCGALVKPSALQTGADRKSALKDPDELTAKGIGAVFVGDGFLITAVILSATHSPVSSLLWLLLLVPAFVCFGKGFADVLHARQIQRRIKQAALNDPTTESLPPTSVVDVLKKTISGELTLPSITERTTRDLK